MKRRERRIGFLAFDGVQGLDLMGPLEAFEEANQLVGEDGPIYETRVITRKGQAVETASGVSLGAHHSIENCPALHTLIVSGGSGARVTPFAPDVLSWIASEAPRLKRIGSICTGLFILAQTSLLNGLRVTTHWYHVDEAQARFPHLTVAPDDIFLRHGKYFTAAGVTAGIDLALSLIEEDHGPKLASQVARHLVVFCRRPGDQRQFSNILRHQATAGDQFAELIAWVGNNLDGDLSCGALAQQVNLSERHFRRKFTKVFGETPSKRIERIRVESACEWLVSERGSIEQIAFDVGYPCVDTFRRTFERLCGCTPSAYRRRFGKVDA
ncbi:MAG: helix-turn-helix domain-containing protein [Pseudomonadota bacterium]